jgi:chemotaxis protein histidine kinase CheA
VREVRAGHLEVTNDLVSLLREVMQPAESAIDGLERGSPAPDTPIPVVDSLERLINEAREQPRGKEAKSVDKTKRSGALNYLPVDPERLADASRAARAATGSASELARWVGEALAFREEFRSKIVKQEEALREALDSLPKGLAEAAAGGPVTELSKRLSGKVRALAVLSAEQEESLASMLHRVNDAARTCAHAVAESGKAVSLIGTVSLATILDRFPRIAREAAEGQGKKILFTAYAGTVEVDAALAGALAASLNRCLKIAIARSIETPRHRKKAGKKPTATVILRAREDVKGIEITLSDDGKGLSDRIVQSVEASIGAGLRKRGGSVKVVSTAGKGLRNTFILPRMSAPGRAPGSFLLAKAGETVYAVPEGFIEECAKVRPSETVGSGESERLKRGSVALPVVRLGVAQGGGAAVIVRDQDRRAALLLDDFMGTEILFTAPIAHRDARTPGAFDAGIRTDGTLALILDVPVLLEKLDIGKRRR